MNRRQETVLWIAGLIVAAICAYHGYDDDWIYAYVIPISIVAALLIYRLRVPRPPSTPDTGLRGTAVALLMALAFLAFHHARRADDAAQMASFTADEVSGRMDDLESEIEDLKDR